MGEAADMILNGDACEQCFTYIGPGEGYPRYCAVCGIIAPRLSGKAPSAPKVACPICGRNVRGLSDHMRDAHGGK